MESYVVDGCSYGCDFKTSRMGKISYLEDGTIGKLRIVNWNNNRCRPIEAGLVDNVLTVFRVEFTDKTGEKKQLYDYRK